MAITDELRGWARCNLYYKTKLDELLAIADRIDAAHEAKVSYWQGASYRDGYDEGFASADDWLAQHEDAMAEHGWVKLPVDAEGKPWHIGDMTEHMQTVQGMCLNRHGWYFFGTVNDIDPSIHRHYHEPTVEDVLHELVDEWVMANSTEDEEAAIAEYAAKLQLRGDEQ